jgi:hypothetical protein
VENKSSFEKVKESVSNVIEIHPDPTAEPEIVHQLPETKA